MPIWDLLKCSVFKLIALNNNVAENFANVSQCKAARKKRLLLILYPICEVKTFRRYSVVWHDDHESGSSSKVMSSLIIKLLIVFDTNKDARVISGENLTFSNVINVLLSI